MPLKTTDDWKAALGALLDSSSLAEQSADVPEHQESAPETPKYPRLDIVYERKGRAGKPATIIAGFTIPDAEVDALASGMKRSMGCGGSARGGEILLQGDRRKAALDYLLARGFKARII